MPVIAAETPVLISSIDVINAFKSSGSLPPFTSSSNFIFLAFPFRKAFVFLINLTKRLYSSSNFTFQTLAPVLGSVTSLIPLKLLGLIVFSDFPILSRSIYNCIFSGIRLPLNCALIEL